MRLKPRDMTKNLVSNFSYNEKTSNKNKIKFSSNEKQDDIFYKQNYKEYRRDQKDSFEYF